MRRILTLILALALVLALPMTALARENYYGTVVCESPRVISAPFGGVVKDLAVRKGSLLRAGDPICTLETKKVFSPVAGTVTAVMGRIGDSVEDVKNRDGGVVYITPARALTLKASTKRADKNEGCYVAVGQTVWLESGRGATLKTGSGVVTNVATEEDNLGEYYVQISDGPFVLGEKLTVYRTGARELGTNLGTGTVQQTNPVALTGEGALFKTHVKAGDTVRAGTLLFETVAGSLEGATWKDSVIRAGQDAIVSACDLAEGSSVEQYAALVTLYPADCLQACVIVPETELSAFAVGTAVKIGFAFDESQRDGVVAGISFLAEESKDESGTGSSALTYAEYKVYIDFEDKEGIRTGMFVTVEMP